MCRGKNKLSLKNYVINIAFNVLQSKQSLSIALEVSAIVVVLVIWRFGNLKAAFYGDGGGKAPVMAC